MNRYSVTLPEVALVAVTRGMGGAGIGLLTASAMRPTTRRALGIALLAVGVLSTIPLILDILAKPSLADGRDFERRPQLE